MRGRGATGAVCGALAALWAGAACSLERSAGDGRFRCDEERACPDGRVCSADGYCEPDDLDAAPPPDAGAPTWPCGTTGLLREDFETISIDNDTWIDFFAPWASVDDGRLVFEPPNTTGSSTLASTFFYLLRDSWVSARVIPAAEGTTPTTEPLFFLDTFDARIGAGVTGGDLIFQVRALDDSVVFDESIPYDPEEHAYWRLRHEGDRFLWDTSPDGADWTERADMDFEARGRPVRVFLWANAIQNDDGGEPAAVAFDDVNLGAPSVDGFCGIDSVSEAFADSEIDLFKWERDGCTSVADGHLRFASANPTCRIETRTAYDMRDGEVMMEVVEPGPGDPTVRMDLVTNPLVRVRIELKADETATRIVSLQKLLSDVPEELDSFELDPEMHRWWGFRHERGDPDKLYFRFSPDGEDWTEYPLSPSPDVSSARLEVSALKEAAGDGLGPVELDNLNLPTN